MRIVVIGLVFAAVILAGGTAYLLNNYLSSQEAEFASRVPKAPTSSVLVAKTDLPAGTVINDSNTEWTPWPEDAVQKIYIVRTKGKDPLGKLMKETHFTRRAVSKGDPITMEKLFKSDTTSFMRGTLSPGMRAVPVKANPDIASGGFILPGDRVDLMLTHSLLRKAVTQTGMASDEFTALEFTSETIMENIRVLAIDQKVNEFEGGAVVGKTVLLEVTPKQAEIINTAKKMGTLHLVLRSAADPGTDTTQSFTTDVEVSPLLSNFENFMAGQDPRTGGAEETSVLDIMPSEGRDEDPMQAPKPFLKSSVPAPSPVIPLPLPKPKPKAEAPAKPAAPAATAPAPAKEKRIIKVYRGTVPPVEDADGGEGGAE